MTVSVKPTVCNKCGGTLVSPNHPESQIDPDNPPLYGLVGAKVRGHYSSYGLTDLTEYSFSICEGCLKTLFESFKHPPDTRDYEVWEDFYTPD